MTDSTLYLVVVEPSDDTHEAYWMGAGSARRALAAFMDHGYSLTSDEPYSPRKILAVVKEPNGIHPSYDNAPDGLSWLEYALDLAVTSDSDEDFWIADERPPMPAEVEAAIRKTEPGIRYVAGANYGQARAYVKSRASFHPLTEDEIWSALEIKSHRSAIVSLMGGRDPDHWTDAVSLLDRDPGDEAPAGLLTYLPEIREFSISVVRKLRAEITPR